MDLNLQYFTVPLFQKYFLFLLPGVCVGLLALVWAVRWLCLRLIQEKDTVSTFVFVLLFSDAMELLLLPFLMTVYFDIMKDRHFHIMFLFFSVRLSGLYFHQLVALEGILSLSHPLSCRHLASPVVSIPLSITLWMSSFTFDFPELASVLLMVGCGFLCIVTVASWVLALKAPHSPPSSSHRSRGPALRVLAVAQFTQFFIHGPSIFYLFAQHYTKLYNYYYGYYYGHYRLHVFLYNSTVCQIIFFFSSLRLIVDPLLCVMMHKGVAQTGEP